MSDTNQGGAATYLRLQIAYFLQFAIWGSYGFALFGYAMNTLGWNHVYVGFLGAAVPLGAFIGPLVFAPIADRYLPAQKVLAGLQVLCGVLLLLASKQTQPMPLIGLMFLVGVFYMPTIALLNAVVFKHVPNSNNAPYVFVFGTIGWILVVLFIQAFFGGGETAGFFYVGAGACFLLALYAMTLPNTPPQAAGKTEGDALGLKAFSLLKDPSFLAFTIAILLAGIAACGFFFTVCVGMLSQRGFPAPLALTTVNQFSELFFMTALPFCAYRFGLKRVLLLGMGAWFLRYVCWLDASFSFALAGLLLHGLCYSFLYNASYMYGEKVAPPHMKASVQGMLAFLLLGVGQVLGALLAGYTMAWYPAPIQESGAVIAIRQEVEADQVKAVGEIEAKDASSDSPATETEALPVPTENEPESTVTELQIEGLPLESTTLPGLETEDSGISGIPTHTMLPSSGMSTTVLLASVSPAGSTAEASSEVVTATRNETTAAAGKELKYKETKVTLSDLKNDPGVRNVFPAWNDKDKDSSAWRYLELKTTLLGPAKKKVKPEGAVPDGEHLGIDLDADNDKVVTYDEIVKFPKEGLVYNGYVHTPETLLAIFREVYAINKKIAVKDVKNEDIKVSRAEYLAAQSVGWKKILLFPMALAGMGFVIMLLFGKDPKEYKEEEAGA